MGRAFHAEEKREIEKGLRQAAGARFLRQGIRKTTVSDLASDAGIAKGSFYHFYESKEALLISMLEEEEKKKWELLEPDPPSPESFFSSFTAFLEESELLRALFLHGEIAYISRILPREYQDANREDDDAFSSRLLQAWGIQGNRKLIQAMTALTRMLFFASVYQSDIGEGFEDAFAILSESLSRYFKEQL
jgi:AcrR family transcriptional regulator